MERRPVAVFQGVGGTVTVENGVVVKIAGMQFAVDGYTVAGDPIELLNSETVIRVGTGDPGDATMTATIGSVLYGAGSLVKETTGRWF